MAVAAASSSTAAAATTAAATTAAAAGTTAALTAPVVAAGAGASASVAAGAAAGATAGVSSIAAPTIAGATAAGGIAGTGISTAEAGLALSGVGTGVQYYGQMKAQAAQRQQMALQQDRQTTDTIRASRIAYANAQNNAAGSGTTDTSSAAGGQGAIESQLGSNLSFLKQYGDYSNQESHGMMFAGMGQSAQRAGAAIFANSSRIDKIFG